MPQHTFAGAPAMGLSPTSRLFALAARKKTSPDAGASPLSAPPTAAAKRGKSSQDGAGPAETPTALPTHVPEAAEEDKPQEKPPRAKPVPTVPPTRAREQELWDQGFKHIVGVDEAGLGSLAGPLIAVACTIPREAEIPTALRSNQRLSDKRRREVFAELTSIPGFVYMHHFVEVDEIDKMNPRSAAIMAMGKAAGQMPAEAIDYVLVDGNTELDEEEVPFPTESRSL
ncbi:ribonuclease H-like domain-containing protein [Dunaliella salina]|uniref:Ribonuclease n=1 Tax=Dunaliella salina TaxID=3046 RepID=A0ABQ7GRB6_DUNSA|nr:ribonuclease H-like domain-containing protein [Dunaliella salina]|eukprot:KAF5837134.1 ribonuclease H-like domain-containing protein [Dunaliella salina]